MTIIHFLVGIGGGGAEHLVLELANQNKKAGHKVIVVGITSISVIENKFKTYGIEYTSLKINRLSEVFQGIKKYIKILKSNPKAIIHAHMFHAGMISFITKIFAPSFTVVFTLHNNYVRAAYRKFLLFLTKSCRNAEVIFSDDSRMMYHKSNAVVIPNGIDTSKFNLELNLPELFTCLFLGRLQEQKNPFYLIDLVLALKDKHNFKINIAGDGELAEALKAKIKLHNLEDFFAFLGFRNDTPYLLSTSHCMIMPSLWEGMPISILEAGAAGVPIVATAVGSIPSILNTDNSYVCSLDKFSENLSNVMKDYNTAKLKASKLKVTILTDFDIRSTALKHHILYQSVL